MSEVQTLDCVLFFSFGPDWTGPDQTTALRRIQYPQSLPLPTDITSHPAQRDHPPLPSWKQLHLSPPRHLLSLVGYLKLRSFKLSDYDVGLLFLYCENDGFSRPKVTGEYSIKTDFYHKMLNGTVFSRWHRNTNFIRFKNEYLVTLGKVYPTRGFGSRSSAKSEGVNVYTGIESSSRAIGNPFTEPSIFPFQQLWSSTLDITYHPVVKNLSMTLQQSRPMLCVHVHPFFTASMRRCSKRHTRCLVLSLLTSDDTTHYPF